MITSKTPSLSTTAMRAVVVSKFGGTEVLVVKRNIPIPKVAEDEVLVKVAAAGVNPVDTYIRSGNYGNLPILPYIPGSDVCGTIMECGDSVERFREGDRVCSFRTVGGAYAEFTTVKEKHLLKLSDGYEFSKGAAVGTPFLTAYRALFQNACVKPGQRILIHGASGGVGIPAVQMAVAHGMIVYGTAGTEEGMNMVKKMGAKYVFNHRKEGYGIDIKNTSKGEGMDCIIEMLSNVNLARDLDLIANKGTILVVGCRDVIEINPRLLMVKESQIRGVMLGAATDEELRQSALFVEAGLKSGFLDPVLGPKYSLNGVQQAHEDIIHSIGSKGKMVLAI